MLCRKPAACMAQRVLWAETNEPIFINRNVIASFRVEEVRGQAVKESDLKRTVRPSTDIHAALLFKDCQQPKFYGWLKKYAIKQSAETQCATAEAKLIAALHSLEQPAGGL